MKLSARNTKILTAGAIFLAALLPTLAFGTGVQLDDSVPDLHIDPIRYLHQLLYAWNPNFFLGMHTGFMQEYLTPYSFAYALLSAAHVPALAAQRVVMFLIYAAIIVSVYVSLRYIVPRMHRIGRLTAGVASCWNIYVAFNSHGSSSMLLAYATMPAFVAVYAAYLDARTSLLKAVAIISGLTLIASGVNPPLLAINVAVIVIFVFSAILVTQTPLDVLRRSLTLSTVAAVAVIAVNLYWIVPFLDFFHNVWLGGILSESTSMHNAATSFSNSLRGFGQWAIFLGDDTGPYYAWANSYTGVTVFTVATWLEIVFAAAAVAFKVNAGRGKVFFLACLVCSLPLVVGYYQGPLGTAITAPLYNVLFTKVPFFQIFRSVYKWESVVALAIACLLGSFVSAMLTGRLAFDRRPFVRMIVVAVPVATVIVAFIPVLAYKMNPPQPNLPSWVANERRELPQDPQFRSALMPSQYLEQFRWGDPSYYIESAIVGRPLVFGYLGSAPFEDSDQWMRRAYREARSGDAEAADVFRTLSVATFLQRDDFRSFSDFAFTGGDVQTSTSQAHDMISRVLGARPLLADGANRFYHLDGAIPVVHVSPKLALASWPADVVAATFDAHALANGLTLIDPSRLPFREVLTLLSSNVPVEGDTPERGGLTATVLLKSGWRAYSQQRTIALNIPSASPVRLLMNTFGTSGEATTVRIDARLRDCFAIGGFWLDCGIFDDFKGTHRLSVGRDPRFGWHVLAVAESTWIADMRRIASVRNNHVPGSPIRKARDAWSSAAAQAAPLWLGTPRQTDLLPVPSDTRGDLVVLPGRGTQVTAALWLPRRFYLDRATYEYNRGEPQQWYALQKKAQFDILSPLKRSAKAVLLVPVSVFGKGETVALTLNGRTVKHVFVPGTTARLPSSTSGIARSLGMPYYVRVPISLKSGVNRLNVDGDGKLMQMNQFSDTAGASADHVFGAIPFLPIVSVAHLNAAGIPKLPSDDVAVRLRLPSLRLWGTPHVVGNQSQPLRISRRLFVVMQVFDRGKVRTRVTEIAQNDRQFDVSLPDMLANSFSDAGSRVIGAWLLSAGTRPDVALKRITLNYTYAMRSFDSTRTRQLHDVTLRFPKGVLASTKIVNLPALTPGPASLDKFEIRGTGVGLGAALALEFNDGKRWRLVGKRAAVTAVPSQSGRSAIISLPAGMEVAANDPSDDRMTVEDGATPVAFEAQATGNRITSLLLSEREAGKDLVVVRGAGEDASPETLVFGKPFDEVRDRPLRVVVHFNAVQNTRAARKFTLSAARLTSTDALDSRLAESAIENSREVTVVRQSPVSLTVQAVHAVSHRSVLVFGESFHPMWHASTNGVTLVHVEANGFANAWLLPPVRAGQTIRIVFSGQQRFMWSAEVSLAAVALLAVLVILESRRRGAMENLA